jgi:uncharacterized protein DUF4124
MPHVAARRALIFAVAACAALGMGPAHGIYKWVDEKGVTHFSEHPPADGRQSTKVEPKVTPPSSDARPKEDWKQRELDMRKQRIERDQKDEHRKATEHNRSAERKNRCTYAQRQLHIVSMPRPVYSVNEKGERVYLEDKDRAAEAAGWRKEVQAYCD